MNELALEKMAENLKAARGTRAVKEIALAAEINEAAEQLIDSIVAGTKEGKKQGQVN